MKILKVFLIALGLLTLTACSKEQPKPIYIDRIVEVKVPVKCIPEDVNCSFDRPTYTEVIGSYLECIVDLKKSIEVCK